jgi:hypothetical protein
VTDAEALARLAAARARLEPLGELTVVALGYAILDLDQAEADANATIAHDGARPAPDDALLGARCRIVVTPSGPWIVLLEPSTEGRLAASLARYGQVPIVEYLAPTTHGAGTVAAASSSGIALSPPTGGPLGLERLVLGNPPWGPHLILVDEDPRGALQPPTATIEP